MKIQYANDNLVIAPKDEWKKCVSKLPSDIRYFRPLGISLKLAALALVCAHASVGSTHLAPTFLQYYFIGSILQSTAEFNAKDMANKELAKQRGICLTKAVRTNRFATLGKNLLRPF